MKCENCIHKNICSKEHFATDIEPVHFYYSDFDNVEEKCNNFRHELKIKEFPCYIGQTVWFIHEGWRDGIKQLLIDRMIVWTIRYRGALTDENEPESRVQIFLGYEDNPYREFEVRDYDFGKTVFYEQETAIKMLSIMKKMNV